MSDALFKGLKAGLEDIIAYKKGEIDLRIKVIELPEPQATYQTPCDKKE